MNPFQVTREQSEMPAYQDRLAVLRQVTGEISLAPGVELAFWARITLGFPAMQLAQLCECAVQLAARALRDEVSQDDLAEALEHVVLSEGVRLHLLDTEEWREIATQAAGQALVAWRNPAAGQVQQVTMLSSDTLLTLDPRSREASHDLWSELVARLDVLLAGQVAKELLIDTHLRESEPIPVELMELARRIVANDVRDETDHGRTGVGSLFARLARGLPAASTGRATNLDSQAEGLILERRHAVYETLAMQRNCLEELVELLMEEETLDRGLLIPLLGEQR